MPGNQTKKGAKSPKISEHAGKAPGSPALQRDTREQPLAAEKPSEEAKGCQGKDMLCEASEGATGSQASQRNKDRKLNNAKIARQSDELTLYERYEGECLSTLILQHIGRGGFLRDLEYRRGEFDPRCGCLGCETEGAWKKIQDKHAWMCRYEPRNEK